MGAGVKGSPEALFFRRKREVFWGGGEGMRHAHIHSTKNNLTKST